MCSYPNPISVTHIYTVPCCQIPTSAAVVLAPMVEHAIILSEATAAAVTLGPKELDVKVMFYISYTSNIFIVFCIEKTP